jgi:glycosyltransferase involved in cell wall biosynthesis
MQVARQPISTEQSVRPAARGEKDSPLAVNLACSGVFHYRQYARYLAAEGTLQRFYYSHRRSTNAEQLGIGAEQAINLWAKEYLTHAHLRVMHHRLGNVLFPVYQDLFDRGVVRNWVDADVLHVMLHGGAGRSIAHAKKRGSFVIGEPVNAHPEFAQRVLREEHERLGLPLDAVEALNRGQKRIIEEAAACDVVLTPTRFVADSFVAEGFQSERVLVLPWSTDLTRFAPRERSGDDRFRVLCVAQISPRKGHVDLLDAWERLNLPNAELVFIGSMTPEMAPIMAKRQHLFTYRGTIPHKELINEFQQADAAVLASVEEGCSYAPMEAMASGLPVVVTTNTGSNELVIEGQTGFVVPIRSPEKIADALDLLYRNPDRRKAMGAAAASEMRKTNDWERYARSLSQLYSDLVGSRRQALVRAQS